MKQKHPETVSTTKISDDKRASTRSPLTAPLSYKIRKVVGQFSGLPEGEGTVLNISDGGLQFRCSHKLGRGSILHLEPDTSATFNFTSNKIRIIRSEKSETEYFVAAEFI